MSETIGTWRYFLSYSGVKLPLSFINPIEETELRHRNTYFRACFDAAERMIACEKLVYGEVTLAHAYSYRADGSLEQAEITIDDETTLITFDDAGRPVPA
jgi:hypothetical protein